MPLLIGIEMLIVSHEVCIIACALNHSHSKLFLNPYLHVLACLAYCKYTCNM